MWTVLVCMGGLHRVLSCKWADLIGMGDIRAVMQAFCAGGDVKTIAASGRTGDFSLGPIFFRANFTMCHFMSRLAFPPPALHTSGCTALVSLIDRVVMGGGAGISLHGPFRVATERFSSPDAAHYHACMPLSASLSKLHDAHLIACMRYLQLLPSHLVVGDYTAVLNPASVACPERICNDISQWFKFC
jgi:hypothetical protein